MDILPAIDLRGGEVVRLAQGDYDRQTTYASDPVEVAEIFAAAGCKWLHMVDLDAALTGKSANLDAVARVAKKVDMKIELGGGVRDDDAVRRVLDAGVTRVIVGSAALENWPWFESLLAKSELAGRVALGLDAKNGLLAKHGWTDTVDLRAVELASRVDAKALSAIIYTDISRDGMLCGPNFEATAELIAATDVPVIASGGVAGIDDIAKAKQIGCGGAIIGRAYYEGKIDLAAAVELSTK